jgi:hypothetical protein
VTARKPTPVLKLPPERAARKLLRMAAYAKRAADRVYKKAPTANGPQAQAWSDVAEALVEAADAILRTQTGALAPSSATPEPPPPVEPLRQVEPVKSSQELTEAPKSTIWGGR